MKKQDEGERIRFVLTLRRFWISCLEMGLRLGHSCFFLSGRPVKLHVRVSAKNEAHKDR